MCDCLVEFFLVDILKSQTENICVDLCFATMVRVINEDADANERERDDKGKSKNNQLIN